MNPNTPPPPPLPPLPGYRPSFERAPLGSGPRRDPSNNGGNNGGRRRGPAPKRGGGLLLGVTYFFLAVLLIGGLGVGYLFLNPPSDLIRQKIADQVRAKTGRELVIAGPAGFTIYPLLGVSLKDVSLSAPAGMDGGLVKMQSLDVSVDALSLLKQNINVQSVVLRKPVFDLRIDKDGRKNWTFAAAGAPIRLAEATTPGVQRDAGAIVLAAAEQLPRAASGPLGFNDFQLNDVRLEGATFRFTDERKGRIEQFNEVNARLAMPSMDSPLSARGNLAWHGKRVDFDGNVRDVGSIAATKKVRLQFNARNDVISAAYDGGVQLDDGIVLNGRVTARTDSARSLAAWFGTPLPPVSGFGPLSLEGTLTTGGNVTDFQDAIFSLDGTAAKGTVKVTTGGARPVVDANLSVTELDLNKYLTSAVSGEIATERGGSAVPPRPAPAAQPQPRGDAEKPDAIENLLKQPGTKVYGAAQRAGWSSEKLNLTLLGVADGTAQLNIGKLYFKKVSVGQSLVNVAVRDHAMRATFEDVQLYQGRGKGVVTVDGSSGTANIGANLSLAKVSALPFLRDAASFEWVAGNANVGLQLAANGQSQLQLIESLNGKAQFKFADGAIVGFNLPGALRGVSRGDFSGLRRTPSEKTDFSALSASFAITNGVTHNEDLQLVSPLLRVTGSGVANMPARTLDYTVRPKLVASLEGQESGDQGSGIEIPVRITGSWDRPSYQPDLKGVLSDPGKTVDTIKQIGKSLKGKNSDEIVDKIFGKKNGSPEAEQNKKSAKQLLNKFLGKGDE